MFFSSPVAGRTRAKKALFSDEKSEEIRGSNIGGGSSRSKEGKRKECSKKKSEKSVVGQVRIRVSREESSDLVKGSEGLGKSWNFLDDDDDIVEIRKSNSSRKKKVVINLDDSSEEDERERSNQCVGGKGEEGFELNKNDMRTKRKRADADRDEERSVKKPGFQKKAERTTPAKPGLIASIKEEEVSFESESEEKKFEFKGKGKSSTPIRTPKKLGFCSKSKQTVSDDLNEPDSGSSSSDSSSSEDFVDEPTCSSSKDESTSCSIACNGDEDADGREDGDDCIEVVPKGSCVMEDDKEKEKEDDGETMVEKKVKRRKAGELHIQRDHSPITSSRYNCIAHRTRASFNSRFSEKKTMKKKLEPVSHPIRDNVDKEISSSSRSNRASDLDGFVDEPECSSSKDESTSHSIIVGSGDEDGDDSVGVLATGSFDREEKDEKEKEKEKEDEKDTRVEKSVKRRKIGEMHIPVPSKADHSPVSSTRYNCIAQRTRASFNSRFSEKKTTKKTLEPVSYPVRKDVDKVISSSLRSDRANDFNDFVDTDTEKDVGSKEEGKMERKTERMNAHAPKRDGLFKLFVKTIWAKGEVLGQESMPDANGGGELDMTSEMLPLNKFAFGLGVPKAKEKSDYEKDLDKLWGEFDFCLRSNELGSFGPSTDMSEDENEQKIDTKPSNLCKSGDHELILDEQIGIKCQICSFVQLEIKYILPSLSKSSPWNRSSRQIASDDLDFSPLDGFNFTEKGFDLHGFDVHTEGTVWEKFPGIRNRMYPHQQDGFEFLWRNIAGGINLDNGDIKNSNCSNGIGGCVISHAPGTGKTFLTIAFLRTYMEVYKECRPVILAPASMLLTWEEEFKKWKIDLPFHNLNSNEFSGSEDMGARKLVQSKPQSQKWNRIVKLVSWSRGRSILGISYSLFQTLAGETKRKRKKPMDKETEVLRDKKNKEVRKILLDIPTLLVLDEGHTPRNAQSNIWKALKNVKTEKRIILSGTPFQNNFKELYNTLCLVRPKFADRLSSKGKWNLRRQSKLLKREQGRGNWASLTSSIGTSPDDKLLEEVRAVIDPFVHVHRGSILQKNLPGLRDSVIVLHPPTLQKKMLEGIQGIKHPMEQEYIVSLVSVHPSLLACKSLAGNDKSLTDKIKPLIDDNNEIKSKDFKLDPNEGVKTRFLMELIRLSDAMNEKVLVFSQFIDPISLIKDQLQSHFNWREGKEVLQMDGKVDLKLRQSTINLFNDPSSDAKVLLASTKACREGISLIGASRIVLLDVVWNPSVERQAISRAYRLGQRKVVHTYHLLTSGTMEGDKYYRQVQKDRLSKLVFSTDHGQAVNTNKLMIADDQILEVMVAHDKLKHMFDKIIYQPKESNLIETFGSAPSKQTGAVNHVQELV